jgi:hypothetical protein
MTDQPVAPSGSAVARYRDPYDRINDLETEVAAKDAEIARLTANVQFYIRDCHICHHDPKLHPICSSCGAHCLQCKVKAAESARLQAEQRLEGLRELTRLWKDSQCCCPSCDARRFCADELLARLDAKE